MIAAALAVLENEGRREELSDFYEKYKNRFLSIALHILHNKEGAEDAVQEAFLKIADRPDTFFSLNEIKRIRYLCTAVKNASIDFYNKSRKNQTEELTDEMIFQHDTEPLEKLVLDDISHKELIEFIKSLPKLQQNVLVLTRLSEMSISETAQVLNISEAAVNQRLYLARKAIRQFIEERRAHND